MELRDLAPEHLDDLVRVRARSFGHSTGDPDAWRRSTLEEAEAGRYLCVVVDGEAVAAARIWDFRQWWHGRAVSMAGVASVVVAPEARGRGVARFLMQGVLARSRELGHPVTALYPATATLYRRLGYEYAGARHRYTFDTGVLRALPDTDVDVRRGGPDDAALLLELVAGVRSSRAESGPIAWDERHVREWLEEPNSFLYLAEDGFVVYGWDRSDGSTLLVEELVAASPETARALCAVVGSGASIAKRVHVRAAPHDPVHFVVPEESAHEVHVERWMLRLLDTPAAVAARGWPSSVELDTVLRLEDAELPDNGGLFRLVISGGRGSLTPETGGDDADVLTLGARAAAALYAGTPLGALRGAGLVRGGDPELDGAVDAAFATPSAYLLDYF